MPLHDYRCESCGYEEEVFQKMGEKPLKKKCPYQQKCADIPPEKKGDKKLIAVVACGGKMERLISGGLIGIVKETKTVGAVIEKNNKLNGRKLEDEKCREQEKKNKGKKSQKPHWTQQGRTLSNREVAKLNKRQLQKYVREGKK